MKTNISQMIQALKTVPAQAYDMKCEEAADLAHHNEHLRKTLAKAAEWFRLYERQNQALGTKEGRERAEQNAVMAMMCEQAINSGHGDHTVLGE